MNFDRRTFLEGAAALSAGAVLIPRCALASGSQSGWSQVWSAPTYVSQAQLNAYKPDKDAAKRRFAITTGPGGQAALTETIAQFNPHAARSSRLNPTYVWQWAYHLPRTKVPTAAKGYAARNYVYITAMPKSSRRPAEGKWDSLCIGVEPTSGTGSTMRNKAASLMTYFGTRNGYCQIQCGFEGITPNNGKGSGHHYLAVGGGSGRIDPGRWHCIDRYMVPESKAGGKDGVVWIDIDGNTVSKLSGCQFFERSWWGNISYMHDFIRHMWGGNEDDYPPDRSMKHYMKNASGHLCMDRGVALSMKLPRPSSSI